jgi:carbamoyltransferase
MWIEPEIRDSLGKLGVGVPDRIYFAEHHESHAASAFYPSPFQDSAILTVDGVGEWATASIARGRGNELEMLQQLDFPHSLGLLYSAFTYYTGFKVNSAEYKLMGLAPYGEGEYTDLIRKELIDIKEDGSFRLNMDYFGYLDDLVMTNERFSELFGGPPREPEGPISRREMNLAKSIQEVTEDVVIAMARHARKLTGQSKLCMAGGVALNCVANGKLLREGVFEDIWIQPAAGDAGGALGAASLVWHKALGKKRRADGCHDAMHGAYLGPEFSRDQIRAFLDAHEVTYRELPDEAWADEIAKRLADEKVVGLFHGRMEFGPRALGNRSIVGDPRSPKMQSVMNLKIKYRESFRPFAPAVLEECASEFFDLDRPSPYMLLVAPIREERRVAAEGAGANLEIHDWVNRVRSDVPAITHVDFSARVQTVSPETNPAFHSLIEAFREKTGCGCLINTSFNVRGEPIVCTPEDAYRCFMRTEMDFLVLGPFLLDKLEQGVRQDDDNWQLEIPSD